MPIKFFESLILRITNKLLKGFVSLLEVGSSLHNRIWESEARVKRMSGVLHMIIKASCLLVLINIIFGNFVVAGKTESHDIIKTKFEMMILYLGYVFLQLNFLALETWWFWRLIYSTLFWVVYKLVERSFMPEFEFSHMFIVCYTLTFCTNLCKNSILDWNLEDIKRFLVYQEDEANHKIEEGRNLIKKPLPQTQVIINIECLQVLN